LNNFRIGLFGTSILSGESGFGAAFLETSGFHGGEFDVSYRRLFPIVSNRLYVYPGITLAVAYMEQNLLEPYMEEKNAEAATFLGRGIGGIEFHLARKVRVGIEASWSQSNTLSDWKIEKGGDTPSTTESISVPDELLHYSGMELGGYELGATLRIIF
jgi:hypothetical protein